VLEADRKREFIYSKGEKRFSGLIKNVRGELNKSPEESRATTMVQ